MQIGRPHKILPPLRPSCRQTGGERFSFACYMLGMSRTSGKAAEREVNFRLPKGRKQ